MVKKVVGTVGQELAKLRLAMRTMRGNYTNNVRSGRCEHDPQALAEFDKQLEIMNGRAKSLPAKR